MNKGFFISLLALLFHGVVLATPFNPTHHEEVLCLLPSDQWSVKIRSLQSLERTRPLTNSEERELIYSALEKNRLDGGASAFLLAKDRIAKLSPKDVSVETLFLKAICEQRNHDFSKALETLDQLLKTDPRHQGGWLVNASIFQLLGRYEESRAAVIKLFGLRASGASALAGAHLASVNGETEKAFNLLIQSLPFNPSRAEELWGATLLAEVAARLGRMSVAREWFGKVLIAAEPDFFSKLSYCDFLLQRSEFVEAANFITSARLDSNHPFVLLRQLEAERGLKLENKTEFRRKAKKLKLDLFDPEHETIHWRERARFLQRVVPASSQALTNALENWKMQKEPIDARLVLETALSNKRPQDAEPVIKWVEKYRWPEPQLREWIVQVRKLQ
jgi:tetratricopeptide (TPR) repeat protein